MNPIRAVLQLQADSLALWLDEALHDAAVTEEAFVEKVGRYGEVLRRLKQVGAKGRWEA